MVVFSRNDPTTKSQLLDGRRRTCGSVWCCQQHVMFLKSRRQTVSLCIPQLKRARHSFQILTVRLARRVGLPVVLPPAVPQADRQRLPTADCCNRCFVQSILITPQTCVPYFGKTNLLIASTMILLMHWQALLMLQDVCSLDAALRRAVMELHPVFFY